VNLLDPAFLFMSIALTAVLFAAVAFFTRATRRRIAGALVASAPLVPLVLLYDTIAARLGWWRYPSVHTGNAPWAWYIAAALGYGAAFGLIGWRVIRRWATSGLIAFVVVFARFGAVRDYLYNVISQIIIFGSGPLPFLADLFSYASAAIVVQLIMRRIAGPAQSDALARIPKTG
jgi:hypothetical protein